MKNPIISAELNGEVIFSLDLKTIISRWVPIPPKAQESFREIVLKVDGKTVEREEK